VPDYSPEQWGDLPLEEGGGGGGTRYRSILMNIID